MLSPPSSNDGDRNGEMTTLFPDLEGIESQPSTVVPEKSFMTKKVIKMTVSSSSDQQALIDYLSHELYAADSKRTDTNPVNHDYFPIPKVQSFTMIDKANHIDGCSSSTSRNAILARENREKKKRYIEGLERKVEVLEAENSSLKSQMNQSTTTISDLQEEVEYLKNVLYNQSALSSLLEKIPTATTVKLRGYTGRPKRQFSFDHDYGMATKKKAGVCLHVLDGSVAIEFCKSCNKNSNEK